MFSREDVSAILEGISDLNTAMGIWAVIVPVFFAAAVMILLFYAYKKPGRKTSAYLMLAMAVVYLFSGWTIFSGKDQMGFAAALSGSAALWLVSVLLILDGLLYWTHVEMPEKTTLKIISFIFMFSGIFIYPLLEILLGFKWPGMVLFGAECPTTIFLIGLFTGCVPKVNKILFLLISVNAVATGFSVAINGAAFDFLYAAAGITGLAVIIMNFRLIFTGKVSESP